MWFRQLLQRQTLRRGDALALRDRRRDVTWRVLDRDARALAAELMTRTSAGDRVAILSGNRVEVIETHFACALSGTTAVPLNPALTDREIDYILESVKPMLVLADESGRARLERSHPELSMLAIDSLTELPDGKVEGDLDGGLDALSKHPVLILHTSATSGSPKGVVADESYFLNNALSWIADVRVLPDTMFLQAGPLFHGSVILVHNSLAANSTVCLLEQFTPQGWRTAIERWRVTETFAVPSMVRLLLDSRRLGDTDFSSLRLILTAGSPLLPELVAEVRDVLGIDIRNNYGITEAGGLVTSRWPQDRPPAPVVEGATCLGVPIPGVSVRVVDGTRVLPTGAVGVIEVRSASLMREYWSNPTATADTIRDGWLHTGDVGFRDDAGFVWMLDRRNDLILRGGQNVYPAEIEQILHRPPWVTAVAVVGGASQVWGQVPVAFVEAPADAFDEAELFDLCRRNLASYKIPVRFVRLDELPRNAAGKALRRVLREQT